MISGNDKRKERHLQSKIDKLIVERDNILNKEYNIGEGTSRELPIMNSTEVILDNLKTSSKFQKHQLSLETMDLFKENKQAIQKQLSRDNFEDSPKQNQMLPKKKQIFWDLKLTNTVADGANPKDAVPYERQTPPLD